MTLLKYQKFDKNEEIIEFTSLKIKKNIIFILSLGKYYFFR